jgi:diguanylate cyclase (GGDEF)-like protein
MGDNVLKAVGSGLRNVMRVDCEVMRLAGDEFALVSAAHRKGEDAVEMVAAVKQLLGQPFQVSGQEIFVDASLGIALYPNSARDAESLLRAANAAMHAHRVPPTALQRKPLSADQAMPLIRSSLCVWRLRTMKFTWPTCPK